VFFRKANRVRLVDISSALNASKSDLSGLVALAPNAIVARR